MSSSSDVYTHGHQEPVLRSHRWRTAGNSAAYLTGRLRPGLNLLDVGCGPGTITVDLARLVAPGRVVGIDREASVVEVARRGADGSGMEVDFAVGDCYALDFPDASFDVAHAHQLLQHLSRPVAALAEMKRVLRPGGLLAVRDSDYGGFLWNPSDPVLDEWMALYHRVCARNGAEADAGRHLLSWVRAAGFGQVVASSSTWTFADPESRAWWCGVWADRVVSSGFAEQAVAYGLATPADLGRMSQAWRRWADHADGIFVVVHGEVTASA